MGTFHPFLDDEGVRIIAVRASEGYFNGQHAASLSAVSRHFTYLLQDGDGQIKPTLYLRGLIGDWPRACLAP